MPTNSYLPKNTHTIAAILFAIVCILGVSVLLNEESDSSDADGSGSCGSNVTWSLTGSELIISGTGPMYDYSYSCGDWGTSITKVTVGEGVTSIGNYAFYKCAYLSSVTLPTTLTSIGNYSFANCSLITSVPISGSPTTLGDYAFSGCTSLKTFDLNDSTLSLGQYSFYNCTALKSVTGVGNITGIGNYAFSGCKQLSSFTLNDSITSIGSYAFNCCTSITAIDFNKVKTLGDYAFSGCTSLNKVVLPDSITTIGQYSFSGCTSVNSVTFGSGITSLGAYSFSECTSLVTISIPSTVTAVPAGLCYRCTGMSSVNFHDNISIIDEKAFYSCSSLSSLTLPQNLVSIGQQAFCGCSKIASLVIPDDVTTIGFRCFAYCTGLQSFTMSKSLSTLGDYVFSCSSGIYNICSEDGIKTSPTAVLLAGGHFEKCSGTSYNYDWMFVGGLSGDLEWSIADGKLTFSGTGESASYGSTAFLPWGKSYTELIVDSGVTKLGCYMFNNCSSLQEVTIADTVSTIEENAFGSAAFYDYTGTVALDATAANLSGHTFVGASGSLQLMRNGFTAIYKFSDGSKAADDVYSNISVGTTYSITSPAITGYSPDHEKVEGTLAVASEWVVVTYSPNTYTLTIRCVDTVDESILSETTVSVLFGGSYSQSVSSMTGYTAEKSSVTGTMDSEGKTETVGFTPNKYTLTISYIDYDTYTSIADTYSDSVYFGRDYSVDSPVFTHKTPSKATVSGKMDSVYGASFRVYYSTERFDLVIQCLDAEGSKVSDDVTRSVGYGRDYSYSAPSVDGYTSNDTVSGTMDAEGKTVSCIYSPNTYQMTITYILAETGREIDTQTHDVLYNSAYSFESPTMAGYTPNYVAVDGKMDDFGKTANVVYYIDSHDVKVTYIYQDGTTAVDPYTTSVVYGKTFVITSPRVSNYTADLTAVSGTMGASDLSFEVVYNPNSYHVTVYYIYSDGTAAADANTVEVAYGKAYNIASPVLAGYVADKNTVAGTIGSSDVSYNVVYSSNGSSTPSNGGSSPGDSGSSSLSNDSSSTTNTILIAVVGVIAAMSLICSVMVLRRH